jgi:tRNA U55 pseudouridine synthase TruB
MYEYAREGIVLEREARPVTIHELELVAYEAPFLTIRVTCSKGTYVRVLGEDIGAALGCGAHLNALRRVQVGALTTANMVTLEELQAHADPLSLLAPVDALLSSFPQVAADARAGETLPERPAPGARQGAGRAAAGRRAGCACTRTASCWARPSCRNMGCWRRNG